MRITKSYCDPLSPEDAARQKKSGFEHDSEHLPAVPGLWLLLTLVKTATKYTVTVTFTASVLGPETAYVTITDSTPGSPHNMYLLGVGKN